jgi:hypothetical protein
MRLKVMMRWPGTIHWAQPTPCTVLSRCRAASAKCRRLRNCQAAATAVRRVVLATPRSARFVWVEMGSGYGFPEPIDAGVKTVSQQTWEECAGERLGPFLSNTVFAGQQ